MNTAHALNRLRMAAAIADLLEAAHAHLETDLPCSDFARGITSQETRDIVAGAANHKSPSDETWNQAVTILEARERATRRVACAV
jgi:hypothetical protein